LAYANVTEQFSGAIAGDVQERVSRPTMQDRYVGDVGDFGKYGLLRALCGLKDRARPFLSLGVVWYLTIPDELGEINLNDGKHVGYLSRDDNNDRTYRSCDAELYDKLALIVNQDKRKVSAIQAAGILPRGTVFVDAVLRNNGYPGKATTPNQGRLLQRDAWLKSAYTRTARKDIVFLDPDNGLASDRVNPCSRKGTKYVLLDDLEPYINRNQSLIIYHHTSRQGTAQQQADRWKSRLRSRYPQIKTIWALVYRRGSSRTFFIIPSKKQTVLLRDRLQLFRNSDWVQQAHFHPFNL